MKTESDSRKSATPCVSTFSIVFAYLQYLRQIVSSALNGVWFKTSVALNVKKTTRVHLARSVQEDYS